MSRETLVASTFVELADTWEDYFDVRDFLQYLVDRSVQILDASTACLTLADARGDLRLVASTSHALPVLDLIALSNAEGPGRDAFASGEPVINVPSADAVARWPRFVNAATELEFRATQVMPLRLRSQALGALMLLYADDVELTEDDQLLALAMVKIATIGMLQERTSRQRELLAERFQGALHERRGVDGARHGRCVPAPEQLRQAPAAAAERDRCRRGQRRDRGRRTPSRPLTLRLQSERLPGDCRCFCNRMGSCPARDRGELDAQC